MPRMRLIYLIALLVSINVFLCDETPILSLGGRPFFGRVPHNGPSSSVDTSKYENYLDQKLDHFSKNSGTFKQRYFLNTQYKNNQSLHILFTEGDNVANASRITNTDYPHVGYAKSLGATLWALEHRYYGQSRPFDQLSAKNLAYLSSQQAIEDISDFIRAQNKASGESSAKWILIGGGYGGSLVIWHRQKYPSLTIGAISSGASATSSGDFYEYQRDVEQAYLSYSKGCFNAISYSILRLKQLIQYDEGRAKLSETLNLKPAFDEKNPPRYRDLQNFFNNIAVLLQIPVQYNRVNAGPFAKGVGIADVCKIFNDATSDSLSKVANLAKYVNVELQGSYSGVDNNYTNTIAFLQNENYDNDPQIRASTRASFWQNCNEFAHFTTTNNAGLIFGSTIPSNFFINLCVDVFGHGHGLLNIEKVVGQTRKRYGATKNFKGSNAVILRGSVDPWQSLAIQNATQTTSITYLVQSGAHCAELQPPSSSDLYGLKNSRNMIRQNINKWINKNGKSKKEAIQEYMSNMDEGVQIPKNHEIVNWHADIEWNVKREELEAVPENRDVHFLAKYFGGTSQSRRLEKMHAQQTADTKPFYSGGYVWQDVDHYSASQIYPKWKQRFYYNNGFKKKDGPIFLMLGGESYLSIYYVYPFWSMSQWARQFGASIYALEHRYYGYSLPTADFSIQNLTYLTSEQAIGDIAVFVTSMNKQYNVTDTKQKWVIFGGSYAGNLAAWFRLKYPDLSLGAVASSAPVQARVDFYDYIYVVHNSTRAYGGKGCARNIHRFFAWAQKSLMTIEGREKLSAFWCMCDLWDEDYVDEKDAELLLASFVGLMSEFVQYDDEGHDFVDFICFIFEFEDEIVGADVEIPAHKTDDFSEREERHFLEVGRKLLQRLRSNENEPKHYYDDNSNSSASKEYTRNCDYCYDFSYAYYIKEIQKYYVSYRSWIWQTCNEFGFFQSTNVGYNLFESSVPVNFYIDMCRDIFGDLFANRTILEANVKKTNDYYGGVENYNGTEMVFVNGSEDPWHALSTQDFRNPAKNVTSILIDGTSHCEDMYRGEFYDRPELKAAHKQIRAQLKIWLT
ncbi:serine carboxypeptidase s28 domain-containing protein [Ditylenchus destructor]|uniref:Serine carboxypeptidase s28 domain-containing protein n=1 Tax=Ditylenchus destructor TaxID=166010 RepID=A0AAD4RBJ5_9BILA|nr:serine carboxypeptidase s28 domain-containing protein [Ditylenchus destructor]